ncbi:MAG: hypothetical protein EZS28_009755 [Streblomastix strix]|uniref:Uncharacterized protein n=1 Tax=Streblomastix strix TaxID=222440 RepID=A0A5J4WI88_9EUKA|nr:MAG: hypothetical protein EZS28_009755 [Streblomastix strix]
MILQDGMSGNVPVNSSLIQPALERNSFCDSIFSFLLFLPINQINSQIHSQLLFCIVNSCAVEQKMTLAKKEIMKLSSKLFGSEDAGVKWHVAYIVERIMYSCAAFVPNSQPNPQKQTFEREGLLTQLTRIVANANDIEQDVATVGASAIAIGHAYKATNHTDILANLFVRDLKTLLSNQNEKIVEKSLLLSGFLIALGSNTNKISLKQWIPVAVAQQLSLNQNKDISKNAGILLKLLIA